MVTSPMNARIRAALQRKKILFLPPVTSGFLLTLLSIARKPATIATNAVNVMHGKISMMFPPPVTSWRNIPSMNPIHTREPDTSIA